MTTIDKPMHLVLVHSDEVPAPVCCTDEACNSETCQRLPASETCGTCLWAGVCKAFVGPESRRCGFFPRRFAPDLELRKRPKAAAR